MKVRKNIRCLWFFTLVMSVSLGANIELRPSDHYDGSIFHNNPKTPRKSFFDYVQWRFTSNPSPQISLSFKGFYKPESNVSDNITISFIGHSSFLLQARGINVLTDPIWSERCSPVSFIGPKRLNPPGIRFEDLPKIDVVVISHNHYDHLDLPTLKKLWDRDKPIFVVPLKNKELLFSEGIGNIAELDWWQSLAFKNNVTISLVPARHWSGRGLFDRDETLWGGYVISFKEKNIFFAGDTGFGPHFEQIKERFGAFSVALLPIGAYLPIWFMKDNHLSPEEVIKVADILKARITIPMHFGTFALGDDGYSFTRMELEKLLKNNPHNTFKIMDVGDSWQQRSSTTTLTK